jgi:hypothetical protein
VVCAIVDAFAALRRRLSCYGVIVVVATAAVPLLVITNVGRG